MPAEPSPQCSKIPLFLTSHLCLNPPNTLPRPKFIFAHLSFPSACYMSSLIRNVQYNYKALHYTLFSITCCFIFFGSNYLAHPFGLEHAQCMNFHLLCGSQPHIHIKFHRADIDLISGFCRSTWGFMLFWDVMQVDWEFVTYILGQPVSPIVKGQAPRPLKMEPTGCP